mmetsp:Transcript_55384/g.115901  ORF Transcript_55384/g.115901 Transcript_55384/m.115901 type:complete len:295 (+) Transcript_55384:1503-2387(+)
MNRPSTSSSSSSSPSMRRSLSRRPSVMVSFAATAPPSPASPATAEPSPSVRRKPKRVGLLRPPAGAPAGWARKLQRRRARTGEHCGEQARRTRAMPTSCRRSSSAGNRSATASKSARVSRNSSAGSARRRPSGDPCGSHRTPLVAPSDTTSAKCSSTAVSAASPKKLPAPSRSDGSPSTCTCTAPALTKYMASPASPARTTNSPAGALTACSRPATSSRQAGSRLSKMASLRSSMKDRYELWSLRDESSPACLIQGCSRHWWHVKRRQGRTTSRFDTRSLAPNDTSSQYGEWNL